MPPTLASFLTWGFIAFLFRRDFREKPDVTKALWIPLLWMLLICTRAVSEWLNLFGFSFGGTSLEEGSPIDALAYYSLMGAGFYVLAKRRVQLSTVIRNNPWLAVYFLYCLLSILWSDFPFSSFKRWTKVIGHPIMALIIFTEPDPEEALARLMKRCAYVIVPISILFIKYYPQWGRSYSQWTGMANYGGIAGGKNALGYDCLILGLFYFWHWLQTWRSSRSKSRRNELILTGAFLCMIWWLLSMAQSSTSFGALLLGVLVILILGARLVNKKLIGTYIIVAILAIVLAQSWFGIYDTALSFLHRDSTLTERTGLWEDTLRIPINPVVGTGFESFWLGERLIRLQDENPWGPNQAHNGYLETYLNLGIVGLLMLIGVIFATFFKVRRDLLTDFQIGRFEFGFLFAALVYNWTEAGFKALHPIWFVFYLIALDYPKLRVKLAERSQEHRGAELVYVP